MVAASWPTGRVAGPCRACCLGVHVIVTQADARRIIRAAYGEGFAYRLTGRVTIGVRPVSDPRPTLAWIKVAPVRHSAVRIGRLLPDCTFDWQWSPDA